MPKRNCAVADGREAGGPADARGLCAKAGDVADAPARTGWARGVRREGGAGAHWARCKRGGGLRMKAGSQVLLLHREWIRNRKDKVPVEEIHGVF